MELQIRPPYEIDIVGNDWREKLSALQKNYLPNAIYLGGSNEGTIALLQNKLVTGSTMIYVCEIKTCRLPVQEVSAALKQIQTL
jgi:hypothetical protein